MLENLKFISRVIKKGVPFKEIKKDAIKTLIELDDPELICLFIASTNDMTLTDLHILIECVKNKNSRTNLRWIDALIRILKNKPEFIQNELSTDINELVKISKQASAYEMHRNIF